MSTLFLYNNHVDSATLTASTADGSYPATNIQLEPTTKEWRTTAATAQNLVLDLGSAKAVDHIFLVGNALESLNFTSITIEANTSDSWGAPAYSSGAITSFPENKLIVNTGSTQTYQYWRIVIEDSTGGATFTGFSNLFLGQSLTLTNNNISREWSLGDAKIADIKTGLHGQRFVTEYNNQKTFNVSYQLLTKDELDSVETMFDFIGVGKPFYFVLDNDEGLINNKEDLSGYFWLNARPIIEHSQFGLYNMEFSFTEVI